MIVYRTLAAVLALSSASAPLFAQAASPVMIGTPAVAGQTMLPANTELTLAMNDDINTKQNREGDTFDLSVAQDVRAGDTIIIPRGARAGGEITWLTGKGAFGKSGKMQVELRWVDVGGRRVPITGSYRQEGEGNTVATVAAVALLWPAAPFITGKAGVMPRGRELIGHTKEDVAFVVAGPAAPMAASLAVPAAPAAAVAQPAMTLVATPASK